MRRRWLVLAAAVALGGAASAGWAADTDSKSAREREMLHRAQEALRQSQTENSQLAEQKTQAEQKLKAATEQLDSLRGAAKSAHGQLQNAEAARDELTRQLTEAKAQIAALTSQQRDAAKDLSARDAQLKESQEQLTAARNDTHGCEAKNLKLYEYSQELLKRYKEKGVWAALGQKEPVLGIKEVGMENVVQEYHEKLDSQKAQLPAPAKP